MAFRLQGTSAEDQELVVAVREAARVEGVTFSEVVRQALRMRLDGVPDDFGPKPMPSEAEVASQRPACEHRWERGPSGLVRCAKCGVAK